jgi:hypothetical protein
MMGNSPRLVHLLIGREEILPPSPNVPEQQFAENQFVAKHIVAAQEAIQAAGKRLVTSEESDPDGCVDQDHQAALRFFAGSLRRETSWADGSVPRRARSLS